MERVQGIIDGIAHSSAWSRFCKFLVKTGQDVASCKSYNSPNCSNNPSLEEIKKFSTIQRLTFVALKSLILTTHTPLISIATATLIYAIPDIEYEFDDYTPYEITTDKNILEFDRTLDFGRNFHQEVCFTHNDDLEICCILKPDMSLICHTQDISGQCISFNMLDNDNPLHNCCRANYQGVIICNTDLCSDPESSENPYNECKNTCKTIIHTYNKVHQNLAAALEKLGIEEEQQPKTFSIDNPNLDFLKPYLKSISKNLGIKSCNHFKEISFNPDFTNNAQVITSAVKICRENAYSIQKESFPVSIKLGYKYEFDTLLDFTIGHELAHIYQTQRLLELGYESTDKDLILPGFEISADILGALASNYETLAAIGMQWLSHEDNRKELCSIVLPVIDRKNAINIANLLKTDRQQPFGSVHPAHKIRGTILLKLSTMIKAAVKYLEQIRQRPINQSNSTQNLLAKI